MRSTLLAAAVALAAVAGTPARALDGPTFTLSAMVGAGSSLHGDDQDPFDASAFQLAASMVTQERTLAVVRFGKIELGDGDPESSGPLGDVEYLNLAGEYRFRQASYDFGIYLGLGGYRAEGRAPSGKDEEALGFALGLTGTFDLTSYLSVVAEFDFHYPLFDDADLYGVALAGLAVHF